MRVLLLALLLMGCAKASQEAGLMDPDPTPSEADLSQPPVPSADLAGARQDIPAGSRKIGEDCQEDTDCITGLCRPVLPDGGRICVSTCRSQADCANLLHMFCSPTSPGSQEGFCVPRHSAHCASCSLDNECGSMSERCFTAPGDISAACHIDCSLAGAAACPEDYTCTEVMDSGQLRKLCRPKSGVCLDSLGGYCDRIALPQVCLRSNAAGTCSGQRNCLALRRYDKCNAPAPQYKTSCSQLDPAGCRLQIDPAVLRTKEHCGACGHACPGLGLTNNDVSCIDPANRRCDMTCRGDNYDVDKNPANGCEQLDTVPPGHTLATAAIRPDRDCYDFGDYKDSFTFSVMSDSRVHVNPSVPAFNSAVGAAPDYIKVRATGGAFCQNDYAVRFTTRGGGAVPCYRCTIYTDRKSQSVTTTGSGTVEMSSGSGSYSSNSDVYFVIEKICNLPVQEAVTYTVEYHL
ncbi:MAG: hypothetical protein RMK29_01725 [Myxococcales bacterium]|nr:hypothetical protein [Myxococcota bacterium]MDW8280399.1 hypothetical protein [Myxococcales bacterium]